MHQPAHGCAPAASFHNPLISSKSAAVRVTPMERYEIDETRDFNFDLDKVQFFDPETGANVGLSV
jgi:hypothetical protein